MFWAYSGTSFVIMLALEFGQGRFIAGTFDVFDVAAIAAGYFLSTFYVVSLRRTS